LNEAVFSVSESADRLVGRRRQTIPSFNWVAEDGTILTKTYTFDPFSYLIDLKIIMKNASDRVLKDQLVLSVRKPIEENARLWFCWTQCIDNDKLEQIKTKKIEDKDEYKGKIKWISVEDRYFLSSIIPSSEVNSRIKLVADDKIVENQLVNPVFELSPGTQKEFQFPRFYGPKEYGIVGQPGLRSWKGIKFRFF
jgi:YidC/Oxa1 family membrane protein insertase